MSEGGRERAREGGREGRGSRWVGGWLVLVGG